MKRKGLVLLASLVSICAITSTVLFVNSSLNDTSVFAVGSDQWHHYAAVEPTETKHGSKEFWANESNGCKTYTFIDPEVECIEHDFSTYESFETLTPDDDRYVPTIKQQLGIDPCYYRNQSKITYGLYPKDHVDDESLLTNLNLLDSNAIGSNGWYLYEGKYYAKLVATPYSSSDGKFDNGETIVSKATYWFYCEPIKWDILKIADGKYLLLSSMLLDTALYHHNQASSQYVEEAQGRIYIKCNDYKYSDIRSFLLNDFSNSAFGLGDEYIQATSIPDNPTKSTLNDKVFLLSSSDYQRQEYGFIATPLQNASTSTRYCKNTEWARAKGAKSYTGDNTNLLWNNSYWTNTPWDGSSNVYNVYIISQTGSLTNHYTNEKGRGVRPAINISF